MADRRLLVLDDDELTGQTIQSIAEFAGYRVTLATNAKEFFSCLARGEPDIIALDLVMPDMDGVEILAELGRRRCGSRIIITSGVGNRVLDAAGRSAAEHGLNIAGILAKPFTPSGLRGLLDTPIHPGPEHGSAGAPGAGGKSDAGSRHLSPAELEAAIRQGQLTVSYQPKVACQSGALSGFEALVRWRHPRLGTLPPDSFIPMAESRGLIHDLTIEVLNQALRWFSEICQRRLDHTYSPLSSGDRGRLTLSLNISAMSLSNLEIFDHVNDLCLKLGVAPQRLIFELTETSAMEDPVTSLDLLTRLRMKGFRLSIDDFGTGYSSMVQLVRLPFTEIKVDKSFVATTQTSAESRAVIKSIVDLAHSLGLQVTAEGIEDEESLVYLRNIGCDLAQGFFIARPMEGAQVERWLASREPSNEQRRLEAVHSLGLLDTDNSESFDRLTHLASRLFNMPIAGITLVDQERVWFKARHGLGITQFPRNGAFCAYTIEDDEAMIVPDARGDHRFATNAIVTRPGGLRFYAGVPLHASEGSRVGSLCLLDHQPREFSPKEVDALKEMGKLVEKEFYAQHSPRMDRDAGVLGMAGLEDRVSNALGLCARLGQPSTLVLVRIQNLEAEQGPESGKRNQHRLAEFTRILSRTLRDSDIVGRFGEDKFLALMVGAGRRACASTEQQVARMIEAYNQASIAGLEIQHQIGLAELEPGQQQNLQSLLARAEMDMYRSVRGAVSRRPSGTRLP